MKKILKSIIAVAVAAPVLTGCVEDATMTNGATADQIQASTTALENLVWAMPGQMNKYELVGTSHWDWGYGSLMHIRDVMTADMAIPASGYNWYTTWSQANANLGDSWLSTQYVWQSLTKYNLAANNVLLMGDDSESDPYKRAYRGIAYAFRAFAYLDMARMYEFLPATTTKGSYGPITAAGNDVTNYTVPIVTEKTTEEESRNNPRVKRDVMFNFILGDLDKAEDMIASAPRPGKTVPNLAVVYGLKARLYMWVENYPKAREYARLAINEHGPNTVTTEEQWTNTATGFNDINTPSWMWGMDYVKEDDVVQSGIVNWTSWMCNEQWFGYASVDPLVQIGSELYDKIADDDFRKLSFLPSWDDLDSPLWDKIQFVEDDFLDEFYYMGNNEHASLKFRPGSGNTEDYTVGCVVGVPLMRVEEMYLIEAEAAAHTSAAEGKSLIESFMQKWRQPSYTCQAADVQGVVDEIFLQKRIELFGEGLIFFDYKRLDKPVIRAYPGTNWSNTAELYNTPNRPSWMNFVFVRSEPNNNQAMVGWNNPDPSGTYQAIEL